MQYLQNLQKLMVKDLGFGYTLGEAIPCVDPSPLFTLHRSTKKEDGSPALVLAHVPGKGGGGGGIAPSRGPARADLARAALRQLRSVRHPDVLRYVDSAEAPDGTLYIATEAAVPLSHLLASDNPPPPPALLWGLFTLSRALGFLHSSGKLHGRLSPATVFVTSGGDWRLGGFDAACTASTAATALPSVGIADLQYARYMAPEMARGDWASIAAGPVSAVDSWAYGCLMYEVHSRSFTSAEQLRNVGFIPKGLVPAYQKLLASNPAARAPAGEVVTLPALARSPFVTANLFVEDLALKGAVEREAFLAKIPGATEGLPDGFCLHKLLPLLDGTVMAAATAGAGGVGAAAATVGVAPGGTVVSAAAVAVVLHLHGRLPAATFSSSVLSPYVVRWVAAPSADRSLRTELLSQLATFAPALSDADINGGVFAGLVAAFSDANSPALRDAAVKSSLAIAPRLTDKHLNVTLMGHFARLQLDAEPAIRTNTTVCIGKLASRLTPAARAKVLLPAFLRALKDPFPPARSAALAALLAAVPLYSTPDAAVRVLPAAAPCLVDASADVRSAAFALLAALMPRLEAHSADMGRAADAAAASAAAKGSPAGAGGGSGPSSGLGSTGWGMSSLSLLTSALLKTGAGAAVANGGSGGVGGTAGGGGGAVNPAVAAATQRSGAGVGFGSDSWSSSAATSAAATAPAAAGNGPPSSAASSGSASRMAGAAASSGGRPSFGVPGTAALSPATADNADDAGSDWGDLDDTFGGGGGGGGDDDDEEAAAAAAAAAAATGGGRPGGSTSSVDAFFGVPAASPAGARRPPGGGLSGIGGLGMSGLSGRPAGPPATSAAAPPRRSPAGRGRPVSGHAASAAAAAPPTSASGRPLGRLAAAAASRKSEADDWEALLGSTAPARPRKR
ncbi:hypothetical protein MMPV_008379 [Pyropia vietnamensis]